MWRNLQVDHESVAYIAASALQPILVIAVTLQVVAPRLAPERGRDLPGFNHHRRQHRALLAQLACFPFSVALPFGDRDISWPLILVVPCHGPYSFIAALRSMATSRMMSSLPNS